MSIESAVFGLLGWTFAFCVIWVIFLNVLPLFLGSEDSGLDEVRNQRVLGDADFADDAKVHSALLGNSHPDPPMFED